MLHLISVQRQIKLFVSNETFLVYEGINIYYLVKIKFRQIRSFPWNWDVQIPNKA